MNGRAWVVYDRVAIGKKSRASLINQLVELGRGISAIGTIELI